MPFGRQTHCISRRLSRGLASWCAAALVFVATCLLLRLFLLDGMWASNALDIQTTVTRACQLVRRCCRVHAAVLAFVGLDVAVKRTGHADYSHACLPAGAAPHSACVSGAQRHCACRSMRLMLDQVRRRSRSISGRQSRVPASWRAAVLVFVTTCVLPCLLLHAKGDLLQARRGGARAHREGRALVFCDEILSV